MIAAEKPALRAEVRNGIDHSFVVIFPFATEEAALRHLSHMAAAEAALAAAPDGTPSVMGVEPDYPDMEEHGLDEPLDKALREILLSGQGDDDGPQIMPDFEEGENTLSMVHACIALLEKRRDVIEGYQMSALTPPKQGDDASGGGEVERLAQERDEARIWATRYNRTIGTISAAIAALAEEPGK